MHNTTCWALKMKTMPLSDSLNMQMDRITFTNRINSIKFVHSTSLLGHLVKQKLKPNDDKKQACDLMFPRQ